MVGNQQDQTIKSVLLRPSVKHLANINTLRCPELLALLSEALKLFLVTA